ncbi:MAG TPA: nucleoside triphosphate pyrophosphohydrolase [Gemmatimonadales bacterium]|jgi:MazG family protein|nr:nucleoside triphosphate pyrophosphohydrolase [Gemmatimonadales bacterium]
MQGDSALGRALGLVRDLRARCPWDRAQTPHSLRPYLIEEVLELEQAIQTDDPAALRDELGDVLLHLAFQIVIGEERSQFNAEVVTHTLEEKMWRRHPHLYAGARRGKGGGGGGGRGAGSDHEKWELVKRREPRAGGKRGTLAGLPPTLPPLLMAYRLQERAGGVGFDWPDAAGPMAKVKEEVAELEGEKGKRKGQRLEEELGDLLFAVVNLARKLGIEPNHALERANAKFTRRFERVEQLAEERGIQIGRASLDELDKLWNEIKATEG